MTILNIIQQAAQRIGIPSPSSAVGSTNNSAIMLLAKAQEAGRKIRDAHEWPELTKEWLITLVDAQANYAFPGDMNWQIFETHWDRNNHWPLIGPLSAQEWQVKKSGISTTVPRKMWRVKGYQDRQFYLHQTPGTGDAGSILVFEYVTETWCRPRTWVTSTVYAAGSYTFYNGNIYTTTAGGTTGATPPTHTSGSVSDGGVMWTYTLNSYQTFLADTDEVIIDNELLIDGIVWRYKKERGFDYESDMEEAEKAIQDEISSLTGASIIRWGGGYGGPIGIGWWSIPDGDFPTS